MAKRSAKQIANAKRYARVGWLRNHKPTPNAGQCTVLPIDFDPPAPSYISDRQLQTLFTPAFKV